MSLINSNQQYDVSEQRRLPVDNVGSDESVTISGETVQFYYYDASGVFTIDAGQAAGTVVVAKLANRNIKNALGDVTGTHLDSSLSFAASSLVTEVAFPYLVAATNDTRPGATKADAVTADLQNGEYCIDYRTGTLYGVKADNSTTLINVSYKIETGLAVTPGGVASEVEIVDANGDAALVTTGGSLNVQSDGYDSGTDSNKVFEVAPIDTRWENPILADETNAADGTYSYYVDMDGYRNLAIQYQDVSGGSGTATLKIYASITGDVDITSADYIDVTTSWTGAASYTSDALLVMDSPLPVKYVKVEVVASTGGADDADWALFSYKQY